MLGLNLSVGVSTESMVSRKPNVCVRVCVWEVRDLLGKRSSLEHVQVALTRAASDKCAATNPALEIRLHAARIGIPSD